MGALGRVGMGQGAAEGAVDGVGGIAGGRVGGGGQQGQAAKSSSFSAITGHLIAFCSRPVMPSNFAPSTIRRCFSNTSGQTMILAAPVSSSKVMKITPLAVPGR